MATDGAGRTQIRRGWGVDLTNRSKKSSPTLKRAARRMADARKKRQAAAKRRRAAAGKRKSMSGRLARRAISRRKGRGRKA